jgi:RNA polymerase sigma-70 factor (ECF subfamily)
MKNTGPKSVTEDWAQLSDELLAIRCQLGEPGALDTLVTRWHEPLSKYVRRLVGDSSAAAEVLQDVWLRILRALPRLREPARVRSWVFAIAHRVVMDRFRAEYAQQSETDIDVDNVADFDEADDTADRVEELQTALDRLPAVEREVLVLFYLRELTLSQIADALEVPVGTVKSRLFRARRLLRQALTIDETQHDSA